MRLNELAGARDTKPCHKTWDPWSSVPIALCQVPLSAKMEGRKASSSTRLEDSSN